MENLQHFVGFLGTWNWFAWSIIASFVTATLAVVLGLHKDTDGWKIGLIYAITFFIGIMAPYFPLF